LNLKKCNRARAKTGDFKKHLIGNILLEVVQVGLGLLLCLLVEVFWDG